MLVITISNEFSQISSIRKSYKKDFTKEDAQKIFSNTLYGEKKKKWENIDVTEFYSGDTQYRATNRKEETLGYIHIYPIKIIPSIKNELNK
jgi:hypothetical protein